MTDHDSPGSPIYPEDSDSHLARWALTIYALVMTLMALVGVARVRSAVPADAPIGGVFLLANVFLLGLPWSLPILLAKDGLDDSIWVALIYVLLAVLNAVLLLWLVRSVNCRRRPD